MGADGGKYVECLLYPENMISGWEKDIDHIIQLPYAYCIHNKDVNNDNEGRKCHVHLILVFKNTTTLKYAQSIANRLSIDGKKACPLKPQSCIDIRYAYNYLIHDTDNARSKGKFQYSKDCRITGNGFDIAVYETRSAVDTNKTLKKLEQICLNPAMMNFKRVVEYCLRELDDSEMEVLRSYSGYLERITKGNYLDFKLDGLDLDAAQRVLDFHESNERDRKREEEELKKNAVNK